mgnify:CR=1 FL=1
MNKKDWGWYLWGVMAVLCLSFEVYSAVTYGWHTLPASIVFEIRMVPPPTPPSCNASN